MSETLTRREFLKRLGAGAAFLALSRAGWSQALETPKRPNIVLIFSDDQGYADMGCQGCTDIPTPHLDAICEGGTRFTSGYVTAPVCSPSRAGLMTGRYQQRYGHEHNPGAAVGAGLPLSETTLATRLKAEGYATGMVGKWHLGMEEEQNPINRGFDEFFGFLHGAHSYLDPNSSRNDPIRRGLEPVQESEYLTDAFARESCDFIQRHAAEPFFLYLAFNAVHTPLEATRAYMSRFPHIEDPRRRTFAGMMAAMDDAVGHVLNTLQSQGLQDDTLVFFISDNGGITEKNTSRNDPLRGYKGQVYEGGIRVPFAARWPGHIPAGMVYDRPVSSLDVVPTVLAAGGATIPRGLDGVNLVRFLSGAISRDPHEQLCWRMGRKTAIRSGDWKLLHEPGDELELYNLAEDIAETNNLAAAEPGRLAELQGALAEWDSEMIEPLWIRESFKRENRRDDGQGRTIEQRFERLDADGDGRVSRDEAGHRRWFERADQDGDGFLTLDEARKLTE